MARAGKKRLGYRWHLRQLMAARDMFATTDLVPLLAERGVELSARAGIPAGHRHAGAAEPAHAGRACDILDCTPSS